MATATPLTSEPQTRPVEPDFLYEVVDSQIMEKPPMGVFEVLVGARLIQSMILCQEVRNLGIVIPEMLFLLDRARNLQRRPDVAFVSRERWPLHREVPRTEAWDVIPDLAVEVISPTNRANETLEKVTEYFRAGVRLVWVIYPSLSQVYVYSSPTLVRILSLNDNLDGGAVLPGFRLPLNELFGTESTEHPARSAASDEHA